MKKILLLLVLSSAAVLAVEHVDTPPAEDFGHTRFWDYYTPHASNYIGSQQWWEGDNFTGDWWGTRNFLSDSGLEIVANYTNNIAGNPVGGKEAGFTYTDNFYLGAQLNLEKMIGWKGASLTISGLDRNGTSLSEQYIGNQFTVQQIFGGQTIMFYALVLEQKLWDDKISLKAGRFSTGDDFASSPIYWLYMNNGIDGNPQALPVNTQFSAYPWAVWAARIRVDPTPEFNGMVGVYQVSNRVFNRSYQGLDWSIRSNDGVLLLSQIGWTPEFFKKPVESGLSKDSKAVAPSGKDAFTGKDAKKAVSETTMKGLPGHYWFGLYYSPWEFSQFGTSDTARNSYGFYWHADQMVYQEAPGSTQGLTLWSSFVLSPQQNIAKLPFQANAGAFYKGLLPSREDDVAMLGLVYGKFSSNYAQSVSDLDMGSPEYELVVEWAYRVQITKFMYIQPDVQWIINPGGTGNIPNALVLGAQMSVTF